MPIGPITPGSYVTVSPDASLSAYASVQAPTATMPVVGADIQALTLVVLNIQEFVRGESVSNYLNKLTGGTVSGPLVVSGTADFQATGASRPTFQGGLRAVAGGIVLSAGDLTLSNGSGSISTDLTVGRDALVARHLTVGNAIQLTQRVIATDANQNIDSLYPFVKLPNGVFSGGHLGIMQAAPDGRIVKIISFDGANPLLLRQSNGTTTILDTKGNASIVIGNPIGPGDHASVTLIRAGGAWEYAGE